MKKDLNEIDFTTDEGMLLTAALALITTTIRQYKTPDEVLDELSGMAEEMIKMAKEKTMKGE